MFWLNSAAVSPIYVKFCAGGAVFRRISAKGQNGRLTGNRFLYQWRHRVNSTERIFVFLKQFGLRRAAHFVSSPIRLF